jgi:glycogen operon protein
MQPEDWESGFGRAVGVFLNGDGIRERDRRGEEISDRHFFILFNAGDDTVSFTIPRAEFSPQWEVVVDTTGELTDRPRAPAASSPWRDARSSSCATTRRTSRSTDHSVAASLAALTSPIDIVARPPRSRAAALTVTTAPFDLPLQVRASFDLDAAATSPATCATSASMGVPVADPAGRVRLRPRVRRRRSDAGGRVAGGAEGLARFSAAARARASASSWTSSPIIRASPRRRRTRGGTS